MAAIDETFRGRLLGMLNGESSNQLALAGGRSAHRFPSRRFDGSAH
jgi:hypothetical protein